MQRTDWWHSSIDAASRFDEELMWRTHYCVLRSRCCSPGSWLDFCISRYLVTLVRSMTSNRSSNWSWESVFDNWTGTRAVGCAGSACSRFTYIVRRHEVCDTFLGTNSSVGLFSKSLIRMHPLHQFDWLLHSNPQYPQHQKRSGG